MATATFAERIQDDLAVIVAAATMIDLSNQRDSDASEDTTRTLAVCQRTADQVEAKLGDVGSYDDTDITIGDGAALDIAVILALLKYSQVYSLTLTVAGVAAIKDAKADLEELAVTRRQEASTPVVKNRDNDDFNRRNDGPDWPDDNDTDAP